MSSVFVVDACRTPIGKIKGALAEVRPDHLAADVIKALTRRNPGLDVTAIDDVYWGAANQAGEDNRNVARMAVLLAGLPVEIPGRHGEPAVRVRDGGGLRRGPGHRGRRGRHLPGGRVGVDDPGAVRGGALGGSVPARPWTWPTPGSAGGW